MQILEVPQIHVYIINQLNKNKTKTFYSTVEGCSVKG